MFGSIARCSIVVAALAGAAVAGPAGAVSPRTFVASYGMAANVAVDCRLANPCRAFAEAMSVTSPGGEIVVLDSTGYGPVTISQSVSIIAPPGVYAGISVFSGSGITVSAGAGDHVILQGLAINGMALGATGIDVQSGGFVQIDRCVIDRMLNGIHFTATPSNAVSRLAIHDVTVRNSGFGLVASQGNNSFLSVVRSQFHDSVMHGISISDIASVAISDVTLNGNKYGIFAQPDASTVDHKIAIERTEITGGDFGIYVEATQNATAFAEVSVSRSTIANASNAGVKSSFNGIVRLMESQIAGNATGVAQVLNGVVVSLGNNMVKGNGTDGAPAAPITPY